MNLGWLHTLQGPQQSSPASLIYNGQYFSRLQFSLGYNFLLILNAPKLQVTSFKQSLYKSNIQVIQFLGESFLVYVPLLMIIVALFTYCNMFQKIISIIGIATEDNTSSSSVSGSSSGGCCRSICCCQGSLCCCCSSRGSGLQPLSGEELAAYDTGRTLVMREVGIYSLYTIHYLYLLRLYTLYTCYTIYV